MRRRRLKRLCKRLKELQRQTLSRDELLLKLGATKKDAGRAYGLMRIQVPAPDESVTANTFTCSFNRKKRRQVRRREGRYVLRSNLISNDLVQLWTWYIQLTEVEQAFKELKGDLSARPIDHPLDHRIEAHMFVAFLAYCLQVALRARLRPLASGLTPRSALEKFAAIQMVDVHLPTTDGRTLSLNRYTEPAPDQQLLLDQLNLQLPAQPPPRMTATLDAIIH
jgi:transposase